MPGKALVAAGVLSPTTCADAVAAELLTLTSSTGCDVKRIKLLIRQLIRDQYEHCAQVAEDWVANNDRHEDFDGMQVGDGIAEALRQLADERESRRDLQ